MDTFRIEYRDTRYVHRVHRQYMLRCHSIVEACNIAERRAEPHHRLKSIENLGEAESERATD